MRRNDEGNLVSVWPARFPTATLLRKRSLLGAVKFGSEYMNDLRDPETQIYNPDQFYYYSPLELQGRVLRHICYVDPSKGKKGKGRKKSDYSGFAHVAADQTERVSRIMNAFRKRLSPKAAEAEVIEWFLEIRRSHPNAELWIEENSFGDILGDNFQDELRRRKVDIVVKTKLHTEEKSARLERHSIRVANGGVRFPDRWEQADRRPEWFSEYEDYPAGSYDDTIDAIETADDIAMNDSSGRADFKSSGRKQSSALAQGY
jgi:predicted phage terminase large subunit-like protein